MSIKLKKNWSNLVKYYFHNYLNDENEATNHESRTRRMSMNPTTVKPPTLRFLPTYRLESKRPFHRENSEKIIKNVVNDAIEEFKYNSKSAQILSKSISEEIKTRIKLQDYDRYKLICVVTIGEKYMQSYQSVCSFLWDAEKDGYLSYVVDTPSYFVEATLYYLYYE